jgi:hypothetical protein
MLLHARAMGSAVGQTEKPKNPGQASGSSNRRRHFFLRWGQRAVSATAGEVGGVDPEPVELLSDVVVRAVTGWEAHVLDYSADAVRVSRCFGEEFVRITARLALWEWLLNEVGCVDAVVLQTIPNVAERAAAQRGAQLAEKVDEAGGTRSRSRQ